MKLFLDTADVKEIRALAETGLVDGITTNPSLIAKSGRPFFDALKEICDAVKGPVSAEVTATDSTRMIAEGERLARVAANIVVKVPSTWDGFKACRALTDAGHKVNVTLCFQPIQAMMAAKSGAIFISPFIGRLDDAGEDGMALIREIRAVYDNYGFKTEILAASIRSVSHVRESALAGAGIATMPAAIFRSIAQHPLTDKGLAAFLDDWKKTGQSILDM